MTIKPWLPVIEFGLVFLCLLIGLRSARRHLLIENLPTSKTTGAFIGLVELNGTAEPDRPVTSYLSDIPCVYYRYTVREQYTRTEIESYTDSNGNSQERSVQKTGWEIVASGGVDPQPFYLKDDRGVLLVRPKGADIRPLNLFWKSCMRSDPMYFGKGPAEEIQGSDHVRDFTEVGIPVHTPIFVVGPARQREDAVAVEIATDKESPLFLISTEPEKDVGQGFRKEFWGFGTVGLILVALYAVFGVYEHEGSREIVIDDNASWPRFAAYCGAYALVLSVGWAVMAYNSLVELYRRVLQGWSNIDVQLKRRADLVPGLVDLLTAGRNYEAGLQSKLATLRSQAGATAPGSAGPDPVALSGQIRAVAEAYPDLKANEAFIRLQKELADTEDRIALARNYFNEIATYYNTRLAQIPYGLIGRAGGLKPKPLLDSGEFETATELATTAVRTSA